MASTYQIVVDGTPADAALYDQIGELEVEESSDLPGAVQLSLPVTRTAAGELSVVGERAFRPYANLAVVARVDGGASECLFDGYVLSHKLHVERGVTAAKVDVWGQDASWLMNLDEKVREWPDASEDQVASAIFAEYGISPANANLSDSSPSHPEAGHSLMQRSTDAQLLRELARRSGKLFRVFATGQPGRRTGWFARPDLSAAPVATLRLNDLDAWNVESLDFEWDVMRPTAVRAQQALFDDASEDGVDGGVDDDELPGLDADKLRAFAGRAMTSQLTTIVDDAGELQQRSRAVLRDGGWFVRCQGEAEVSRLGVILRAGQVVQIAGMGSLYSGKYLVWSVRHVIGADAHRMRFVLLRNAMGRAAAGLPGGLL